MESTTESTASSSIIALKYGFIHGIVCFLYTVIVDLMGWSFEFQEFIGWVSLIGFFVLIFIFSILCLFEFRSSNGGYISYGESLGLTTLLGALFGLINGGFNYIYLKFINIEYLSKNIEIAKDRFKDQSISKSNLNQIEHLLIFINKPGFQFFLLLLFYFVITFLLGLIVSAIVKREKPIFD
ncbi:DUF4199 domain-containing protein [Aquirufa sp. HETE-83D]|uniref:DUF4199 domain-containing protein n=1 Tax=Aquirufa esocilacus TaxID=3096513 RepID=A0ABW6DGQ3_9BACT